MTSDTIAAIATPPGTGGIAVVRISGDLAQTVMRTLFTPLPDVILYRHLYYGSVTFEGVLLDKALCVLFEKGASYTGEDICEFHCHGGHIAAGEILSAAVFLGARPAQNGEFTKRAFLNGKLSLSEAEAVCELINADSKAAAQSAAMALGGELTRKIKAYQDTLRDLLVLIDAAIDYPDEVDETATREQMSSRIEALKEELAALKDTYKAGRVLKDGLHVCIAGLPNAGKSSLLNALSGHDAAIVTPIAGTTRDILHETIEINSLAVHLYDTAGLRQSNDEIEQIGVSRAYSLADRADAILYLIDLSVGVLDEDKQEINKLHEQNRNLSIILNKTDLTAPDITLPLFLDRFKQLRVSTLTGEGISQLRQTIYETGGLKETALSLHITNERHYKALHEAYKALEAAFEANKELPVDCVSVDLYEAWQHLGELTGETLSDEIIDRIFEKFCVGK